MIVNQIADLQEFQFWIQVPLKPVSERIKPPRRGVAKTQMSRKQKQRAKRLYSLCVFATWASWRFFLASEAQTAGVPPVILSLMEHELKLRIVLEKPPAGVDFGLQKGRGVDYETIQTQRSKGPDLHFEFTVRAKHTGKNDPPNFLGPFVQGPTGERFVYIDIGTYAGQSGTCWSRRLKIPLRGITWEMVEEVTEWRVGSRNSCGRYRKGRQPELCHPETILWMEIRKSLTR